MNINELKNEEIILIGGGCFCYCNTQGAGRPEECVYVTEATGDSGCTNICATYKPAVGVFYGMCYCK